jgi:pyruvate kinase
MEKNKAIITIPPYADYVREIANHPFIAGVRFNTAMPLKGSLEEELQRMSSYTSSKDFWIDLKCRQIRVSRGYFYDAPKKPIFLKINGRKLILDNSNPKARGAITTPPWAMIEVDHELEVDTSEPVPCYFSDGLDFAHLARVDGNKLIMADGPKKIVGTGESINIIHPSLKIKGYLTDLDKRYIEAGKRLGMHKYMLSYVECCEDLEEVLSIDKNAEIVAKIESKKGLAFLDNGYQKYKERVRLMAARGDLYVELDKPHDILCAMRKIISSDPQAIAASRICPSLRNSPVPSCQDITDLGYMIHLGYKTFMIGDDICFNKNSLESAVNLVQAISEDYKT